VLAATPTALQLQTKRINIRYFTSLTADATEGTPQSAADSLAASVPFLFTAASARQLLSSQDPSNAASSSHSSHSLGARAWERWTAAERGGSSLTHSSEPATHSLKATSKALADASWPGKEQQNSANLDLADLHARLEDYRAGRQLLQTTTATIVNTSDTAFLWMDLNGDNLVNIEDSLLFADVLKLADSDPTLHCTWLSSIYSPSTATQPHSLVRGNSFTDASITGVGSSGWQALDPKLIYLRSNASDVMFPESVTCVDPGSTGGTLEVPQLARFDGTSPLTEKEFLGIVPRAETSDPAGLFKAFFRPDEARDWRMYSV
jgi:hypothetical protein